jgi:uncharacterized membrane protein
MEREVEMQRLRPIERLVDAVEGAEGLDRAVNLLEPVADQVGADGRGAVLRGEWLGHALHPLLTDFPLGCWLAAGFLDLTAPRSGRAAAQRLVGMGLLFVPVTAAAGLADWATVRDRRVRRVGVAHALGNTVVGSAYLLSWRARRRGHHARGVAWGLFGGTVAWATGYLGGHLSFGRGVGIGERGERPPSEMDSEMGAAPATGLAGGGVGGGGVGGGGVSDPAVPDVHQAS